MKLAYVFAALAPSAISHPLLSIYIMRAFEEYFSVSAVAWTLSKYHARIAGKIGAPRRRAPVVDGSSPKFGALHGEIITLLPPRSMRIRKPANARKRRGAIRSRTDSVYETLMMHYRKGTLKEHVWGRKFLMFAKQMQSSAKKGERHPTGGMLLFPVTKSSNPNSGKEFRMVCTCESLEDRVFWSLFGRYLRDSMEYMLHPSVHSFRPNRSHNTAGAQIVRFLHQQAGRPLWAAEVDVISLFDSISHNVVISSLEILKHRLNAKGVPFDTRAEGLVRNYLSLYSRTPFMVAKSMRVLGSISIEQLLQLTSPATISNDKTSQGSSGIPQGGPLSPVLSNLVLHFADEQVLSKNDSDLLYLRYCDDVLICHPDSVRCEAARIRFCDALIEKGLYAHPVADPGGNNKSLTVAKSKFTYKWAPVEQSGVEWVPFLGYEFAIDGAVRLGQKTQSNILQRLSNKKHEIIQFFSKLPPEKTAALSSLSIYFIIRYTFIAAIFGRSYDWRPIPKQPFPKLNKKSLSWAGAFRMISRNKSVIIQLKRLDRHLEACISSCIRTVNQKDTVRSSKTILKRTNYIEICRVLNFYNLCGVPYSQIRISTDADTVAAAKNKAAQEHLPTELECKLTKELINSGRDHGQSKTYNSSFEDASEGADDEFEFAGLSGDEAHMAWDNTR